MTASKVFHVPLEEVTPLQRNAKAVASVSYTASVRSVWARISASAGKRQRAYIQQYFRAAIRAIHEFLNRCVEDAKERLFRDDVRTQAAVPELKSKQLYASGHSASALR